MRNKDKKIAELIKLLIAGKTQAEASKIIGVSEHSICAWLKDMGKKRYHNGNNEVAFISGAIAGFVDFMHEQYPQIKPLVAHGYDVYITEIKTKLLFDESK